MRGNIPRGKFPGFAAITSQGGQLEERLFAGVWTDIVNWRLDGQRATDRVPISTGAEILNVLYHPTEPKAVSILQNNARDWNLNDSTFGRNYGDGTQPFSGVAAYSPNGEFIAFDDATRILIYQEGLQSRFGTINKPRLEAGLGVRGVAISSDGSWVVMATGALDLEDAEPGDITLWDSVTGTLIATFPREHSRTVQFGCYQ